MPWVALSIDAADGTGYTLVCSDKPPLPVVAFEVPDPVELVNLSTAVYVDNASTSLLDAGNIEAPYLTPQLPAAVGGTMLATNQDYTGAGPVVVGDNTVQVASVMPTRPAFGRDIIGFAQPTFASATIGGGSLYSNGCNWAGAIGNGEGSSFYADKSTLLDDVVVTAFGASESVIASPLVNTGRLNCDDCLFTAAVADLEVTSAETAARLTNCVFLGATTITFTGDPGILEVDPQTYASMLREGVTVANGVIHILDAAIWFEIDVVASGSTPTPFADATFAAALGVDATWTAVATIETNEVDTVVGNVTLAANSMRLTMSLIPSQAGTDGLDDIAAGTYTWRVRLMPPILPATAYT